MAETLQNVFLNLNDKEIKGTATVSGHEEEMVLKSFAFDVTQSGEWEKDKDKTSRVTGFSDLTVRKDVDTASPSLAEACSRKTQYDKAEITCLAGEAAYYVITLAKVIISSVAVDMTSGNARPSEKVTFCYQKATWKYDTEVGTYNLQENT